MKSKILLAAIAAMGLGMCASASMADTYEGQLTLVAGGAYQYGVGGEFAASLLTATAPPQVVNFQTFCIEGGAHDVTFSSPGTYAAYLVTQPETGPVSNPITWLNLNTVTGNLFGGFSKGDLTGYASGGNTHLNSAGALQFAIWVAQGDSGNDHAGGLLGSGEFDAEANEINAENAGYQNTNPLGAGYTTSLSTIDPVNATVLSLAYTFYKQAAGTDGAGAGSGLAADGTDVSVLALGTPEGANQAQLVETDALPHIETPLPKSAVSGFALLAGLGLAGGLRKLHGGKRRLA